MKFLPAYLAVVLALSVARADVPLVVDGQAHQLPREVIDRAIWSSSLTSANINDTSVMGEIVFD